MSAPTLIFDLDGTLIDSRHDLADAVNHARHDLGYPPLAPEVIIGNVGDGARTLVSRSLSDQPHADLDRAVELMRYHYGRIMTHKTQLYPGVAPGLRTLRNAGYLLALVSNKPGPACQLLMEHFQIADLFTHIIGDTGTFPLKPHPAALLHILKDNHSLPSSSWMIGDHHTDLISGTAAGLHTALVTYGFGDPAGLLPSFTSDSFSDLVKHFVRSS